MRKPCCDKQDNKNKGVWSKEEDQKLIKYMQTHGEVCWRSVPQAAGLLRCGKSCRLRWINYLRPNLKRGNFTEDEENVILRLHALLGNRWSLIAGRLPGRTDNEVKNYWNSHLRRKFIRMGIDLNKHRLNHNIPCPQNQSVSTTTTSSGSKNQACQSSQPSKSYAIIEQVTDEESFVEDDTDILPDLNLDLTMTIDPSKYPTRIEEEQQDKPKITMELKSETSPALLLFK